VSPALANFLFEAANFLVLAAALGWVLFRPVRRALDAERARHEAAREESDRLRSEAATLKDEARAERETVEREVEARRREALRSAEAEAARLLEEARGRRAAERRALEQELEVRREAETTALTDEVARVAAESVRRLLLTLEGPPLDAALVRAACAELEKLPKHERGSMLVESARPLEPSSRKALAGLLGTGFAERIVPELGAGARIITGAGQVDVTASSIAREAARAVRAMGTEPSRGEPSTPGVNGDARHG
jgi:F0F1-type ATP synthase membrane subunit b/b'